MPNPFRLDDEILAFIDESNKWYADTPENHELSVQHLRATYARMCQAFHRPYPEGVVAQDSTISSGAVGVPIRRYCYRDQSTETAIVYYHGGGYILGGLDSHDSICAELCANTGLSVISVGYRLAPEHKHPIQFDDAMAGFRAASDSFKHIIVAGDSAGGNLAAAVCVATAQQVRKPIGQLLIYPSLGGEQLGLDSYQEMGEAPMLTTSDMHFYQAARSDGEPPRTDPIFSPLMTTNYGDLPPCYAFSADVDPLRDDSKLYVERLVAAGVDAHYTNAPGLIHGHLRARHCSAKAHENFIAICAAATVMAIG